MNVSPTLGQRAARGAVVTVVAQFLRVAVQAIGVMVMARILAPSDFGLLAMLTAIAGIGEIVREFGLSAAAVQAPHLSAQQRSNLFWLNTALGAGVAAVVFLLSWPVALLYDDDRLIAITQVMAITFVLNGIASQYRASLQRALAFTWVAVAELMGLSLGITAAIIGGINGWGYWALVLQYVLAPAVYLFVLLIVSQWLPRGFYRHQNTMHFVQFGWQVMTYQLLVHAGRNIHTVVIGLRFGAPPLGFYDRAFQLLTVPLNQIANPLLRVAVPVLAKVQHDSRTFNAFLSRGQTALFAVMLFLLLFLAALAESIVRIVLGPEWSTTAGIFRILAVAGIVQIVGYPVLWAYLALGLTRVNLMQALISNPLLIILIVAGSAFGIEGVAWAYALGTAIAWPVALTFLARTSEVDVRAMIVNSMRMLVPNLLGALAAFGIQVWKPVDNAWAILAIGLMAMSCVTAIVALLIPPLRRDYAGVVQVAMRAIRR